MTAVWGYLAAGGAFVAFISAVVVASLSTMGTYFALMLYRENIIFGRLIPTTLQLAGFSEEKKPNTAAIAMALNLLNGSKKDIYIKVKRVSHSISNRIEQPPGIPDKVFHLMPEQPVQFVLTSIREVPLQGQIYGRVEVEFFYGKSPDNLKYIMSFESTPIINTIPGPQGLSVNFAGPWDKIEHIIA